MKKNSIYILTKVFVLLFSIVILLLNYITKGEFNFICSINVLIICMLLTIHVKNNIYLFVIFLCISYFNYSLIYLNYFPNEMETFFKCSDIHLLSYGINVLMMFFIIVYALFPRQINRGCFQKKSYTVKTPRIIGFLLLFILIAILILTFERPEIEGQRGSPSSIYEYSIIIFILLFYFFRDERIIVINGMFILSLFALQNFVFGGRITGIQLLIVALLMLMSEKLNSKLILFFCFFGMITMSIIGIYRGNITQFELKDLNNIIISLKTNAFANDTSYSAYYTSLTFLSAKNVILFSERLKMFIAFIISMFLGGGIKSSNLAMITSQFSKHYGGGILPFFFYFYLGPLGILFIAIVFIKLMKMINNIDYNSNGLSKCIMIYLSSTVFRWYLYSPSNLFRGLLIMAICYYFMNMFSKHYKA